MNKLHTLVVMAIIILLFPTLALAQTVTLSWDASPTTDPVVTGYKIYYQSAPYMAQWDGSGATQGASPIDVGSVLTYQLTDLADGVVYYFAVTAYDAQANESTYSNIVQSDPNGDSHLHIGGHGMRFWLPADVVENRGSARF
ncbi:MAG: fibronectin type III domain-containing protein [Candidatus Marinimicrobia bacterium]|nr:fibronectin type III domain-containing protein [Candidatus Neomarinimicrobiota bacterium]